MEQKTSITYEEFKTPSMHQICTKFCKFQMLSRRPIYDIHLYVGSEVVSSRTASSMHGPLTVLPSSSCCRDWILQLHGYM
jgi:hypothetical protein